MGTEVLNLATLSSDQIMEMIGQSVQRSTLAQLKINRNADDDEGRQLPVGTYFVYDNESRQNIYGKPVFFRPFINVYQYRKYDASVNAYSAESILFRNWNEDILDTTGGLKCGKISGKAALSLSESEQRANKAVQCVRLLFGTVTFSGTSVGVKTETVVNALPCVWRSRGVAFKPIGDAIESLSRENKFMFNHVFELTTRREKTGDNVYYTPVLKITDQTPALVDDPDIKHMQMFREFIDARNAEVHAKWSAVQKKKLNSQEKEVMKNIKSLDADFEVVDVAFDDNIDDVGAEPTPLDNMSAG